VGAIHHCSEEVGPGKTRLRQRPDLEKGMTERSHRIGQQQTPREEGEYGKKEGGPELKKGGSTMRLIQA